MGNFGKRQNRGFAQDIDQSFRQSFDMFHGGHPSRQGGSFADNLTRSLWNDLIAPENNRPGREFFRRGWGTNLAGLYAQEFSNDIVRSWRGSTKKKRW
jgi:hypothetical protein